MLASLAVGELEFKELQRTGSSLTFYSGFCPFLIDDFIPLFVFKI